MSEIKELVSDVFEQMLRENVTPELNSQLDVSQWNPSLWELLVTNEMQQVAIGEDQGGAGGDVEDLLFLYQLIGQYAAPIPYVEHTLANYILQQLTISPFEQLVTVCLDQVLKLQHHQLFGTLHHVPWASFSKYIVAVANEQYERYIVIARTSEATIEQNQNLAGEPRDTMHFQGVTIIERVAITDAQLRQFAKWVTASYITRMNGAMKTIKSLSIKYSKERQQFGQPIHRFQLVQQHIAQIAGEQALMDAASSNMIQAINKQKGTTEAAFTRIRMDEASKVIATCAHQLHAAIGVTNEYTLQYYTRRLWAWRDEGYPAKFWIEKLVAAQLAANATIWEEITKH